MKYKAVIFDLDGTILNTLDDLADALNYALARSGYPLRTIDEVRQFVGNGIRRLIERGVPQGSGEGDIERVFGDFNEYYVIHCSDKTRPYEGIGELLCSLRSRGIKTAVVSNKADYGVRELCRQYFEGAFDCAVGERAGVRRKPCPDSVNEVLEHLGIDRTEAVYIGDSEVDIQTARNAEMDLIAVDWGFRDRELLISKGAEKIASNCRELEKMILEG